MINLFAFIILTAFTSTTDNFLYHYERPAAKGDGPIRFLARYQLDKSSCNLDEFYRLNKLKSNDPLIAERKYYLPIRIYRYNGKSIRSTIDNPDYEKAVRIQKYNDWLVNNHLRKKTYTDSGILWVPYHEVCVTSDINREDPTTLNLPILGKKNAKVSPKSDRLKDQVYYLMAGHGGPDPGAVGKRGNAILCEDEYAYDVTLRLYKLLIEQGAQAYMIVQDINDGIRDDEILLCDHDEVVGGAVLPRSQLKRLQQRSNQVNDLFLKHKKKGVKGQTSIAIHVDSRGVNHRQDVFFYHCPGSESSRNLALQLQQTFQNKYKKHRRGNTYQGHVEARNLFVLKNTLPKAIFVELANIQNRSDHRRILQASNRQALANWMMEGILSDHKTL